MGHGSGGSQGSRDLIDSSFYGVYTEPSKPPGIGNLARRNSGTAGSAALTLPDARTRRLIGGMMIQWSAAPQLQFRIGTHGPATL